MLVSSEEMDSEQDWESSRVLVNVGGTNFSTFGRVLKPCEYFRAQLSHGWKNRIIKTDENDKVIYLGFIDRNPRYFESILECLRNPDTSLPLSFPQDELDYYGVEICRKLHEPSEDEKAILLQWLTRKALKSKTNFLNGSSKLKTVSVHLLFPFTDKDLSEDSKFSHTCLLSKDLSKKSQDITLWKIPLNSCFLHFSMDFQNPDPDLAFRVGFTPLGYGIPSELYKFLNLFSKQQYFTQQKTDIENCEEIMELVRIHPDVPKGVTSVYPTVTLFWKNYTCSSLQEFSCSIVLNMVYICLKD